MNCEQFDRLAHDIVGQRREFCAASRAHLAACSACQQRLTDARRLQAALGELRRELAASAPPRALGDELAAHYARHHVSFAPVMSGRRSVRRWSLVAGLAAAIVLCYALLIDGTGRAPSAVPTMAAIAAAPASPGTSYRPAVVTPFYPVRARAGARLAQAPGVVRVNMPRATLAVFGLPFNPRRADDPIAAELLVDNAGAVTAVRFVQ